MFFIEPTPEDIDRALESWHWLPIEEKTPIKVTAFGDIFFSSQDGVWFLDTLEGRISKVCDSLEELNAILQSEEGENHYLLAGFVERAHSEGMCLGENECYDFKLNPVVGGAIDYHNVERQNFVVAVNIAGQIHQQVQALPEGSRITGFTIGD